MKFAVLITTAAATLLTLACSSNAPAASSTPTTAPTSAATTAATAAPKTTATTAATSAPAAASPVTVTAVEVTDTKYQYDPSTLTFKTGDTTVHFQSQAGNQRPHTFSIKNAAGVEVFRSDRIQPGTSADLKISLPDAGTYQFLCVVQGHADKGQTGTLTVTKS